MKEKSLSLDKNEKTKTKNIAIQLSQVFHANNVVTIPNIWSLSQFNSVEQYMSLQQIFQKNIAKKKSQAVEILFPELAHAESKKDRHAQINETQ